MRAGNATMPPRPDEPTEAQLRLAYRQLSHPHIWPASFEAAVAHPVFGKCLRALARNLGRPAWQPTPVAPSLPRAPVPPTPANPPRTTRAPASPITAHWSKPRGVDFKRRAANDVDD